MAIAADYFPLVQQLYVAYFGRPADPAGLQSMANSLLANGAPTEIQAFDASYSTNVGVKTILDNFGGTESANLYGTSPENFVFSFYQNVLGRLPDAAGYSFWVDNITNGTLSMGKAAISMMAGALANTTTQGLQDAAKITNMLAVADDFTAAITTESATYSGDAAAQAARDLLKTITATTDISTVQDDIVSTLYGMTNHAPSVDAATLSIAEGSAADTAVGTVTGTDPDGNAIEFAITSGNDAGYFAINASTGAITLTAAGAAALDYETATSYTLGVTSADASLSSAEQTVTINVTNVNDNTPVISSAATATVAENTDVATVVYQAAATDADGDTVTYSLAGTDAALFDINATTGAVTLKAAANFEAKASYSFDVVATDGTNTSTAQAVTLSVTDVNEAPVVAAAETTAAAQSANQTADTALTATATVVDQDNNFNGGSVTLAVDGAYILHNGVNVAVAFSGANFTLIGTQIVADAGVIAGDADLVIGTISYGTLTDLDTGAGTVNGTNQITITFNNAAVNSDTVQQLLRDIRINEVSTSGAGASTPTQAVVTVTVADAAGLTSSFARLFDATGAMTLANLDGDAVEVEVQNVANVAIDLGGNSTLTENGAQVSGATITVTSSIAGDALHFDNTTQAIGAANTLRLIGDQLALTTNGTTETLIGTVTGAGTSSMTITLNSFAANGDITNILDSIKVNLQAATLGDHAITTTITDGLGLETQTGTSTFTVVSDYSTVALVDLDGATTALAGNVRITVDGADDASAYDLSGLNLTGVGLVRLQVTASADLTGVDFGSLALTTVESTGAATLTINAAQVDGVSTATNLGFTGTIAVKALEASLAADLSGLTASVAVTADLDNTADDLEFTGNLGSAALTVSNGTNFVMAASVASGADVTFAGQTITITGLTADFDASALSAATVAADTGTLAMDSTADLSGMTITVLDNGTLTLTGAQADAATAITGQNAATGADTGGSILITDIADQDDLSTVAAGTNGGQAGAHAGTFVVAVADDTTLTGGTDLNGAAVTVAAGATLTVDDTVITALTVTGAGDVAVVGADQNLDLSDVAAAVSVSYASTTDLSNNTIDFGTATVTVAENALLTVLAADVSGVTVTGDDATVGANGNAGSVKVVIDGAAAYDLTHIVAGAESADANDAGTVVVTTAGTNASVALKSGTTFHADTSIVVGDNDDLTLSATQADGRTILGTAAGGNAENVVVTLAGASSTLDLSGVDTAATVTSLKATTAASIDLSNMDLGGLSLVTAADGAVGTVSTITVTMTAAQADDINTANGGTAVLAIGATANTAPAADDTVGLVVTAIAGTGGVTYTGSAGNDTLAGSAGADTITDGAGNDVISGGAGVDTLITTSGANQLTGGTGNDVFVFTSDYLDGTYDSLGTGLRATISDFTDAGILGGDQIGLYAADIIGAFNFVGTGNFTADATNTEARYTVVSGNAIVEIDLNADGVADAQIVLTGVATLTASDFDATL